MRSTALAYVQEREQPQPPCHHYAFSPAEMQTFYQLLLVESRSLLDGGHPYHRILRNLEGQMHVNGVALRP